MLLPCLAQDVSQRALTKASTKAQESSQRSSPRGSQRSPRGALPEVQKGPVFGPLVVQKPMVFHWFYSKNENLCYHGTGSEESAREGVHGQQDKKHCLDRRLKPQGQPTDRREWKQPKSFQQTALNKGRSPQEGPQKGHVKEPPWLPVKSRDVFASHGL